MIRLILLFLLVIQFLVVKAQTNTANHLLSETETDSLFPEKIRMELGIKYPIYKAFQYKDISGTHFFLLTENIIKKAEDNVHDTIQGFQLILDNGRFKIERKLTDFIQRNGYKNSEENSIWFWTKFVSFSDIDGDGLVEPIIVYGTSGLNGTHDGRIKIIVLYKGDKRAIRHQNGVLDFERNTQVDSSFYLLPDSIQEHVKNLMRQMKKNHLAIFPYGWETAMKNKKLRFDEN